MSETPDLSALHVVVAARAVAPQHGHGGLERATASHLEALARRGVRLTVFTQPAMPGYPARVTPPPMVGDGAITWREAPYRRWPLRRNSILDRLAHYPSFARRVGHAIVALARQERVDLVHAHGLAGLGYAGQLRLGGLPPLVLNPHGLEEFNRRGLPKWLAYAPFRRGMRLTARAAASVIATDRALVTPIARALDVPRERLALIPNGVDVAALDALVDEASVRRLRERYRLSASPLILVSVARLERNKGLREGVAALARVRDRLPAGWRWLIVGVGSEEAALRAEIARSGLGDAIALTGVLADRETQSLFACADLCLVPSLYEGSSLVALEAMARQLPVVATSAGGLPDKVIPARTGFLAPSGDVAAFAAALEEALAARENWPLLGAQARALVTAEFDWAALADRYLDLYWRVVQQ